MSDDTSYEITWNLNVLNHLGVNLYSNVPAVISETVANAWDANAKVVAIDVDIAGGIITITDDGSGMTRAQINNRFLHVGYERRKDPSADAPIGGRKPMGRKGIGKLSLFAIANRVEVFTTRDGEKNGVLLDVPKIREHIAETTEPFHPEDIADRFPSDLTKGTRIVLTDLKKRVNNFVPWVRRRIARRFSVIEGGHEFQVVVGGSAVGPEDRGYFSSLEMIWLTEGSEHYLKYCTDEVQQAIVSNEVLSPAEYAGARDAETDEKSASTPSPIKNGLQTSAAAGADGAGVLEDADGAEILDKEELEVAQGENPEAIALRDGPWKIRGWVGTVRNSSQLRDGRENLNRVAVFVRGKVAIEDLLETLNVGGMFSKYVVGELHADFLDVDELPDIATSSRQDMRNDSPRYAGLRIFLATLVKKVQNDWTDEHRKSGIDFAKKIPALAEWYERLGPDKRKRAASLFGKIHSLKMDSDEDKAELMKHGVLAFEHFNFRDSLDKLEALESDDLETLPKIFSGIDDLEATFYHIITRGRLDAIRKLAKLVDNNSPEKVIQSILFDHLWLLDPSWERVQGTERMEKAVHTAFEKLDDTLTPEHKSGRLDLKYRKAAGEHVVIELKRPKLSPKPKVLDLIEQVIKYMDAIRALLKTADQAEKGLVEGVIVLGEQPSGWDDPDVKGREVGMLKEAKVRLLFYDQLLMSAERAYADYLAKDAETSRVSTLMEHIGLQYMQLIASTRSDNQPVRARSSANA